MIDEETKNIIEELKKSITELEEIVPEDLLVRLEAIEIQAKEREKISLNYLMGLKISGVTHGTPGTQTTHAHGLGKTPLFVFIVPKSNGVVYISALADTTNIYVKGSAADLNFNAFCIL